MGGSSADDLWMYPKTRVLFAARAVGAEAIDGPYGGRIDDVDGFRSEALRANTLGFTGKWATLQLQGEMVDEAHARAAQDLLARADLVEVSGGGESRGEG